MVDVPRALFRLQSVRLGHRRSGVTSSVAEDSVVVGVGCGGSPKERFGLRRCISVGSVLFRLLSEVRIHRIEIEETGALNGSGGVMRLLLLTKH